MKEKFTHKAEMAFVAARDRGAVDKEYMESDPATDKPVFKSHRETPVVNGPVAIDAALLVMIERVKKGDAEVTASQDWLDNLDETDHLSLAQSMMDIRREGRERGKKSA